MVLLVFCKGTVELLIWQILVKSERSRRKQPKLDHLPKHGGAESCGQYLTFPKRYAPWFSSPFCSSKAFCRVVLRYTKKSASTLHETNYDIMMNHEHPFSAHKSTRIGGQAKVKGEAPQAILADNENHTDGLILTGCVLKYMKHMEHRWPALVDTKLLVPSCFIQRM